MHFFFYSELLPISASIQSTEREEKRKSALHFSRKYLLVSIHILSERRHTSNNESNAHCAPCVCVMASENIRLSFITCSVSFGRCQHFIYKEK
jgi:hypothetical protein